MDIKQQRCMLKTIQELSFTAIDLNLYLDTHPGDPSALGHYNAISQQLACEKAVYEQIYGPLMAYGETPSQYPWRWVKGPWPWEI
jgi:spore coat protein JB